MILSGHAHTVAPGAGRLADLGIARMRVLAAADATPGGGFSLAEFTGGPGPWTVPHLHRDLEESFFVLDGSFTFTVGDEEIAADPTPTSWCRAGRDTFLQLARPGAAASCCGCPAGWSRCSSSWPSSGPTRSGTRASAPPSRRSTTPSPCSGTTVLA